MSYGSIKYVRHVGNTVRDTAVRFCLSVESRWNEFAADVDMRCGESLRRIVLSFVTIFCDGFFWPKYFAVSWIDAPNATLNDSLNRGYDLTRRFIWAIDCRATILGEKGRRGHEQKKLVNHSTGIARDTQTDMSDIRGRWIDRSSLQPSTRGITAYTCMYVNSDIHQYVRNVWMPLFVEVVRHAWAVDSYSSSPSYGVWGWTLKIPIIKTLLLG